MKLHRCVLHGENAFFMEKWLKYFHEPVYNPWLFHHRVDIRSSELIRTKNKRVRILLLLLVILTEEDGLAAPATFVISML